MTTHTHTRAHKKHYKINFNILLTRILTIAGIICFLSFYVNFCRFTEQYITTYKYQLYNDLKRGDAKAVNFYQTRYVDNGRILFDDMALN